VNRFGGGLGDHGHQDFGNFNIWRGGRWVTRETSGYSGSWSFAGYGGRTLGNEKSHPGTPLAHNVVIFGTPLYHDDVGLMPSATKGNSEMRRLESRPVYVYTDVDLTKLYLWRENAPHDRGAVVHVERELLYIRPLETTVILDRVTAGDVTKGKDAGLAAASQVNTFLIHFETNPTLEDASHLTAVNGDQALRMTTLVPANARRRVINESNCAGCSKYGQHRVEVDTSGAAQRYFLHVLQARDAAAANIEARVTDSAPRDPEAGTFTVTLHPRSGADTVLVLPKGRRGAGGTIAIAGAAPVRLTNEVATIAYTDDGPVWGEPARAAR
jgi:hypothetical protein